LRGELKKPSGGFAKGNPSCVPAHPLADDPALLDRQGELKGLMKDFVAEQFLRGRPARMEEGDR
jgi:hypothetical protein